MDGRHGTGKPSAPASSPPRVSVLIPAYNATRWIDRTLASVLHQSFADFEIVIVDDGSADDLAGALAPHLAGDPRIRLVRQENRGLAGARNRALAEARADLVAPLDADDIWHPDFLSETVAALDRTPAAPFAYAYSFRMDEEDRLKILYDPPAPPRHDLTGLIWFNSVGSGSAALYRKAPVLAVGGYDEEMGRRGLPGAEDWKLILQVARIAEPVLVERHLVGYRMIGSSMSQANRKRQLKAVLAVLSDLRPDMPEIAAHDFADGGTMMCAWMLPAFIARREVGHTLGALYRGYVRNPLWFRNPSLRDVHLRKLRSILGLALGRGNPEAVDPVPIYELPFEGDYPFAFLAPAARPS